MDTIIKVMGLPRSGTNALNVLLNLNFDNYVCDRQYHWVDYLGWKHGMPPDIKTLSLIEERTDSTVKLVFCYRNFGEWEQAIYQRYSGASSGEFTTYSFGDDGFIFNTPLGGEIYTSLYDFYCKRVEAYQNFCNLNPDKAVMVNFSELSNQEELLSRIQSRLDLNKSFEEYTYLKKRVSFENQITSHKI